MRLRCFLAIGLSLAWAVARAQEPLPTPPSGALAGTSNNGRALTAVESLPTVGEILKNSVEANGGVRNVEALRSLVVSGTSTGLAGDPVPFTMYRKRPNLYRIEIEHPNLKVITTYDGREGHRLFERPDGAWKETVLEGADLEAVIGSSHYDAVLMRLRGRADWLELVGLTDVEGVAAYELKVHRDAPVEFERIWVDAEIFQEIKLQRRADALINGTEGKFIYLSDYRRVDGVWMPRRVRQVKPDGSENRIEVERVRANVGIFDNFFEGLRD